jgi:hypothetical protein
MISNFSDSSNNIIINNIPIVIDNGTTYLSKFRNGLSLDDIIEKEILTPIVDSIISNNNTTFFQKESKYYNDEHDIVHDKLNAMIKPKYHKSMRSEKYNPKKSNKILSENNDNLFETNVTEEENKYMNDYHDYDYFYSLFTDTDDKSDLYNEAYFHSDYYRNYE